MRNIFDKMREKLSNNNMLSDIYIGTLKLTFI